MLQADLALAPPISINRRNAKVADGTGSVARELRSVISPLIRERGGWLSWQVRLKPDVTYNPEELCSAFGIPLSLRVH